MGLTILLVTLIILACIITVFIGKQAKRIANSYVDSFSYIPSSRPTFIRINDDNGTDLIINADEIEQILSLNRTDGKYIIRICLKNQDSIIDFVYNDKLERDSIYSNLYDYNADNIE